MWELGFSSFLGREYANHTILKTSLPFSAHIHACIVASFISPKDPQRLMSLPQQMAGANTDWQASISLTLKQGFTSCWKTIWIFNLFSNRSLHAEKTPSKKRNIMQLTDRALQATSLKDLLKSQHWVKFKPLMKLYDG